MQFQARLIDDLSAFAFNFPFVAKAWKIFKYLFVLLDDFRFPCVCLTHFVCSPSLRPADRLVRPSLVVGT